MRYLVTWQVVSAVILAGALNALPPIADSAVAAPRGTQAEGRQAARRINAVSSEVSRRGVSRDNRRMPAAQSAGIDDPAPSRARPKPLRDRLPRRAGEVLDSTADSENQTAQPDRTGNAGSVRSTQREKVSMDALMREIHEARVVVAQARRDALTLYAIYEQLAAMSEAEVAAIFPNGGHETAVNAAALNYNAAVATFDRAELHLQAVRENLAGGHSLQGNVLTELDALMGEQG